MSTKPATKKAKPKRKSDVKWGIYDIDGNLLHLKRTRESARGWAEMAGGTYRVFKTRVTTTPL